MNSALMVGCVGSVVAIGIASQVMLNRAKVPADERYQILEEALRFGSTSLIGVQKEIFSVTLTTCDAISRSYPSRSP